MENSLLDFAIQTARDAGRILAERFGRKIEISNKSEIDLVTESDLASERLIIERIKTYYPRHSILAEESGATNPHDHESDWRWIIDPLDGTTNYAHGYPCFCVSIGWKLASFMIRCATRCLRPNAVRARHSTDAASMFRAPEVCHPRSYAPAFHMMCGNAASSRDTSPTSSCMPRECDAMALPRSILLMWPPEGSMDSGKKD